MAYITLASELIYGGGGKDIDESITILKDAKKRFPKSDEVTKLSQEALAINVRQIIRCRSSQRQDEKDGRGGEIPPAMTQLACLYNMSKVFIIIYMELKTT